MLQILIKPTSLIVAMILPVMGVSQAWEKYLDTEMATQDSIEVYFRMLKKGESKYLEFKGVTFINASLTSLSAVLRDVDNLPNWIYNMESAKAYIINDTERYTYVTNKSVGVILKQRDSYVHSTIKQDPHTLEVTIHGKLLPDEIPKKAGYIRVQKGASTWTFVPVHSHRSKVVFQGYANPGGMISASWLAPLAKGEVWKLPYYSMKGLKNQVRKQQYQDVEYDFLKDFE